MTDDEISTETKKPTKRKKSGLVDRLAAAKEQAAKFRRSLINKGVIGGSNQGTTRG